MASLFTADFEAGTPPGAITTGNSGFSYVAGPVTYSSSALIGSVAMLAETGATAEDALITPPLWTLRSVSYLRMYVKLTKTPVLFYLAQHQTSSAVRAVLRVNANGSLRMRSASANIGSDVGSAGTMNTSTWVRLEWAVTATTQQLKVFTGANLHGTTPDFDSGSVASTLAGTFDRTAIGCTIDIANMGALIDGVVADDTTWVGPAVTTPSVTAAFTGSGTLTADVAQVQARTAALAGSGSLTAAVVAVHASTAGFTGSGSLAAAAFQVQARTANFTGSGTLTASVTEVQARTAGFAGAGALTVTVKQIEARAANFTGSGALTVTTGSAIGRTAAFTGSGTLTADVKAIEARAASFTGSGALSVTTSVRYAQTVQFTGTGALTAATVEVHAITAAFTTDGQLTALVAERYAVDASFTGSGQFTVEAEPPYEGPSNFKLNASIDTPLMQASITGPTISGTVTTPRLEASIQ